MPRDRQRRDIHGHAQPRRVLLIPPHQPGGIIGAGNVGEVEEAVQASVGHGIRTATMHKVTTKHTQTEHGYRHDRAVDRPLAQLRVVRPDVGPRPHRQRAAFLDGENDMRWSR